MVAFLATLATTVITAVLVWYFSKYKNEVVHKTLNGAIVYRMNKAPLYFFIGFGVVGMFLCFVAFLRITDKGEMTDLIIGLVFTFFLSFVIFCSYSFDKHKTIIREGSIEVISYFGKSNVISWNAIEKIKFNASIGELIISSDKKQKVKINYFTVGFNIIVNTIQEKTGLNI
ncbi:hypothetical protein EAX61_15610 [Dokdonia sinensis]|uniref:Uncharacterized protein n=1 Tax=Dokdonia sinensis TaxID=2479847 RepID=A0A3M0FUM8_9FLAO|nr:hypothetical protein [Dokdonia sinensis]RMB56195.1 hypothetical protein EAX61_15610 [Dokdonia sinensis]